MPDVWQALRLQQSNKIRGTLASGVGAAGAREQRVLSMQCITERLPCYAHAASGVKTTGVTVYAAGEDEEVIKTMTPRISMSKEKRDPREEVQFKYSEAY